MSLRRVAGFALVAVATLVGHFVWPIFRSLGASAVEDWINTQIAKRFGIVSPSQDQVISFTVSWAIPLAAAVIAYLVFRFGVWWGRREKLGNAKQHSARPVEVTTGVAAYAEDIPNLRIADSPTAIALFETTERDKLLPLLEADRVSAWARPMSGHPPLTKLPGKLWKSHYLMILPKTSEDRIAQTFLKTKTRHESDYFDVHLNQTQVERIWPRSDEISLFEAATRAYEQTRDSPIAIVAEEFADSPDDVLTWFCDRMARHQNGKRPLVTLYGNRPPSRQKEEIYMAPLNRYDFVVQGMTISFQERSGAARFENLSVRTAEVEAAIRSFLNVEV
jgi:hypothetical protein